MIGIVGFWPKFALAGHDITLLARLTKHELPRYFVVVPSATLLFLLEHHWALTVSAHSKVALHNFRMIVADTNFLKVPFHSLVEFVSVPSGRDVTIFHLVQNQRDDFVLQTASSPEVAATNA